MLEQYKSLAGSPLVQTAKAPLPNDLILKTESDADTCILMQPFHADT